MKKQLVDKINEIGVNKIRFFIPMRLVTNFMGFCAFTSSSDPEYLTECYIDETRYKIKDKYKITLRACDERFGSETYYISDLESHINNGRAYIKENPNEHVELVWFEQPIGGGFSVRSWYTQIV